MKILALRGFCGPLAGLRVIMPPTADGFLMVAPPPNLLKYIIFKYFFLADVCHITHMNWVQASHSNTVYEQNMKLLDCTTQEKRYRTPINMSLDRTCFLVVQVKAS
jgi:hypothetical protein